MKKPVFLFFIASAFAAYSQPKKAPKMAPMLTEGYYVVAKGDTVRGEIQTNPDDEADFYHKFGFKPAKGGKVMPIDTKKAKAYGFENKHFVVITYDGEDMYVERLASGRLNFFEYKFHGKVDGHNQITASYFVQDTRAEGDDLKLRELKKLDDRTYKSDLKPYMKDQKMIWTDLDKFKFDKQAVVNAIVEFNKFYVVASSE